MVDSIIKLANIGMKNILLADDDPFIIEVYAAQLKAAGFGIEAAQTGEEILKKLKEKKFDLLLLDIVLPETSGWWILEKIRQNKNLDDLKVIIASNLYQRSEVEKGIKLGAVKYLVKANYTPNDVVEEIKKVLE